MKEVLFCETILINENPPVRLRVVPSPGAAAALLAPHPGVGVWRSLPDCGREEGGERAPVQQERQVQQGHLPSVGNVLAKGGACQFGSLRIFVEKQTFFSYFLLRLPLLLLFLLLLLQLMFLQFFCSSSFCCCSFCCCCFCCCCCFSCCWYCCLTCFCTVNLASASDSVPATASVVPSVAVVNVATVIKASVLVASHTAVVANVVTAIN